MTLKEDACTQNNVKDVTMWKLLIAWFIDIFDEALQAIVF